MEKTLVEIASKAIALLSIGVITYGIIRAVIAFVRNEFRSAGDDGIRHIRARFGGYLLFGLELLIGADILKSVVDPTYEDLVILGGIVLLRTILSFFLNREIKELGS